jgi:hypothetical protein
MVAKTYFKALMAWRIVIASIYYKNQTSGNLAMRSVLALYVHSIASGD